MSSFVYHLRQRQKHNPIINFTFCRINCIVRCFKREGGLCRGRGRNYHTQKARQRDFLFCTSIWFVSGYPGIRVVALKSTVKFPLFCFGFCVRSVFDSPVKCCCKLNLKFISIHSIFSVENSPLIARTTRISSAVRARVATIFAHFVRTCRCAAVASDLNCTDTTDATGLGLPAEELRETNNLK